MNCPNYGMCLSVKCPLLVHDLMLRPGITGPASLKYRNEEDLLASVDNPIKYNDEIIYPDKVRINRFYAEHYSFLKDIQMIFCTVLGKHMMYNGEMI